MTPALLAGLGSAVILYVLARTDTGAVVVARVTDSMLDALPRGIRNNNPGNIDWIENPAKRWNGMIRKETLAEVSHPRFGVFDTAGAGVRALGRELLLDGNRGVRTVRGLITAWAPGNENNTAAYIRAVASALHVQPADVIDVDVYLPRLAAAIIQHENGVQPYLLSDLTRWVHS
jgi:hypothetical protein